MHEMNRATMTMYPEVERRFLVRSFPTEFRMTAEASWVYQGYILLGNPSLRIRLEIGKPFYTPPPDISLSVALELEDSFFAPHNKWIVWMTGKMRSGKNSWKSQKEWEVEIPPSLGWEIYERIQNEHGRRRWLSKIRFRHERFELDVFAKQELRGLAILEIELVRSDESIRLPRGFDCIEITGDNRFSNQSLSQLSREEALALTAGYGLHVPRTHLSQKT